MRARHGARDHGGPRAAGGLHVRLHRDRRGGLRGRADLRPGAHAARARPRDPRDRGHGARPHLPLLRYFRTIRTWTSGALTAAQVAALTGEDAPELIAGPAYLYFFTDLGVSPEQIPKACLGVAAVFGIPWIVEPLAYFPVLGSSAMYPAFMIGNISSKLLPAAPALKFYGVAITVALTMVVAWLLRPRTAAPAPDDDDAQPELHY